MQVTDAYPLSVTCARLGDPRPRRRNSSLGKHAIFPNPSGAFSQSKETFATSLQSWASPDRPETNPRRRFSRSSFPAVPRHVQGAIGHALKTPALVQAICNGSPNPTDPTTLAGDRLDLKITPQEKANGKGEVGSSAAVAVTPRLIRSPWQHGKNRRQTVISPK
ncbi:hypothetical protein C0081_18125 [Cohaesibacter celericrescens]|uniref:Uncharacterized protein n=1 Tax=Cohaesibacter celericrescens TaxID=2067669 RepID=A0A2N5XMM3_9HYPH|nr:hypothetical protein C0081_18125 [Cohaesibacter celericrescens]